MEMPLTVPIQAFVATAVKEDTHEHEYAMCKGT